MLSLLQSRNVRRVARCLQALPLAAVTPDVMQQFTALHHFQNSPLAPTSDVPPLCISAATLTAMLARLRPGTAPGLTGWTNEHILIATRRPSARQACITFLKDMLAGCLPHIPELLDSDGLPLRKPARGIRPIAIGKAWMRLGALCAVHEGHDLGPSLAPLQLVVGIPGGAEGVGHAICSALLSHPDHLLLSLDCKSAFNRISR
jgi:hypothetical protein